MAPVLETPRLILRGFRAGDLDAHAAAMADASVVRHLGGTPLSREEAWRKVIAGPGLWELLGYGYWAVERKEDGVYLGQVGFADFKRDLDPSIEGLPEMGWIFAPHAQGKGYATEAVKAGLDWADRVLKAPVIPAIIDEGNFPSIALAERSGFTERQIARYRDGSILLFRRRQDFSATNKV